jgi:prevent-host-death family protein
VQLSVNTVRENLSEAIDRVNTAGERVVLTRKRKGVAAIVSMEDLAVLRRLEDKADLKAARKVRKEKGSVSLAEIQRRLEDEADLKAAKNARKEKGGITLDQYCKKHGL